MTEPQDRMTIETAALDWIVRQRDPDFDDWDGFATWLAAAPAHADMYQAMAVAEQDIGSLFEQAAPPVAPADPANDDAPAPGGLRRRAWMGGALAASLVGAIGIGLLVPRAADPWMVATGPGERRSLALADGSQIILNGGTRIRLDRNAPRRAVLETGEAMFIIHHDERDPFEVSAGSARLVDMGTAFNVVREGKILDLAVSEGAVLYNPSGEAAPVHAGQRLHAVDGESRYILSRVSSDSVAGWRTGRLFYDGQPLSTVAADLGRYYGIEIAIAPAISARPFQGVLTLPPRAAPALLAPLLDVEIRVEGKNWTVTPRS